MTILRVPEGSCEDFQQGSVLCSSNCCRNVFKNLPLVAYRRCTNISDILVAPSSQKLTTRLLPRLFWYHSRNCTTCPTLKKAEIDTLLIPPVNLPSVTFHITCTTFNVIYMIQYLFVIYNTLGKLNVPSNTALMSTGDQYLMVVTSIQQFLIILLVITILTTICSSPLLNNSGLNLILAGRRAKRITSIKERPLSLWALISVMICNSTYATDINI